MDASHPLCFAGSCEHAPRVAVGFDVERSLDIRRNSRATGGHPHLATDTLYVNQSESVVSVGPFADVEWTQYVQQDSVRLYIPILVVRQLDNLKD